MEHFKKKLIKVVIFMLLYSSLHLNIVRSQQFDFCKFERNLSLGSKGEDVKCLQRYLKNEGYFNYEITGYYGLITKKAVKKWQEVNKIKPANGFFGLQSRIYYQVLISNKEKIKEIEKVEKNKQETIILSDIKDEEIVIVDNGFSTFDSYFKEIFIDNSPKINIEKFNRLFEKDPFSLEYVIDSFSTTTDVNLVREKISFLKNFYEQRINLLKKIPVNEKLKNFHKGLIISDVLSLQLANKFQEYLDKKISQEEFNLYYEEYKNKIQKLRALLILPILSKSKQNKYLNSWYGFIYKIFKSVNAQTNFLFSSFGGRILLIAPCICNQGNLITISIPKPIILFVPWSFMASPLLYSWKNIYTPGVWVLGLAFNIPIPCLMASPGGCVPGGTGQLIFMAGTSAGPF